MHFNSWSHIHNFLSDTKSLDFKFWKLFFPFLKFHLRLASDCEMKIQFLYSLQVKHYKNQVIKVCIYA